MDVDLIDLWMPILLGGVLAWIASALIHMALKYHNSDYRALSNEDEVAASLRNGAPRPGLHSIPFCGDMKQMGDPAMQEKFVEAYRAAGGPCDYCLFENATHEWVAEPGPQTDRARETVKAFIARQLRG